MRRKEKAMEKKSRIRKIGLGALLLVFGVGILGGIFKENATAKENYDAVIRLSDKVLPDFSFANSTEDEIKVMTILNSAKAKKRIDYMDIIPGEEQYHEFDLKEYEKESKKLFGKILPHGLREKLEGGFQTYYDKLTKTIYQEAFYDPGDITIKRNKRIVKKGKKNSYVVENWDSYFYPLSMDKKPTKKMEVFIKKTKKGYVISDIKLSDLSEKVVKISEKDVKKQIKNIKKWFLKQPKNVIKKSFKKEGSSYIILKHQHDIIFIYEKDQATERRYYYKDGIPIRVMYSEDGKLLHSYDLSYDKTGEYLVNGKHELGDDSELIGGYFVGADQTYNQIETWMK